MDNTKIPKVIHYCWFGKGQLPDLATKCIGSWKKYLPDYEIVEWNESNFDININQYVKEAYENNKYAFVTDYVRLYVLYKFGGIYMDTDVEVLKNLDYFLNHDAFSGFEREDAIPTGIMGAVKGNQWIKELLAYYDDKHFIFEDGTMDLTTNVVTITNITKDIYNINLDNTLQRFGRNMYMYPTEYFCPLSLDKSGDSFTSNTHTIHHFAGSWLTGKKRFIKKVEKLIGTENLLKMVKIKHFTEKIFGRYNK